MATKKATTNDKKQDADTSTDDADKKKATAARAKKTTSAAPKPKKKATKKEDEEVEEQEKDLRPYITPPPPKPVVVAAPPPPPPAPVVQAPAPVAPPTAKPAVAPATPAAPATPPAKPSVPSFAPKAPARPAPFQKPPFRPAPPRPSFAPRPTSPAGNRRPNDRPAPKPMMPTAKPVEISNGRKKLVFNEMMTVKDLAAAMEAKIPDVIKKLLGLGTPASINQRLDFDTAAMLADGFGFDLDLKSLYVEEKEVPEVDATNLKPRPPVVTVMGHVDHGKTSLLDAIRKTSVVKGEAGGITQHIGAYRVKVPKGTITFLDTPGHEAFTAMRARGGTAADIVILVVAADDSVMPQTLEAIDHAKAAGVPIVVAINKVDLPTANPQKVRQELATHNVLAEEWGGKVVMVEVSARTGAGIDKLLEMILLEAELLELKANPDRPARGTVLEAHLDPRRGNLATVLVTSGTLKDGDIVICGLTSGRVRAMLDESYEPVETAGPSVPVRLLGLTSIPQVGDQLSVVASDQEAREIAERRRLMMKDSSGRKNTHVSLESLHTRIAEGSIQDLPIIMKSDVQGSLQAIHDSLGKLQTPTVQIRFVHSGVGNINSSDVLLAEASDAILFGFNVKMEAGAEAEAKRAGVDIRQYKIIYEMLADVRAAMEGLLEPEEREVVKARAQVKAVFPSRLGPVAGCMVLEGTVNRGGKARVMRRNNEVGSGAITGLRRFKDDVKEVEKGYECGISIENVKKIEVGDVIEIVVIEKHARRLEA